MAHKEKRPAASTAEALKENNSPLFYSAETHPLQAFRAAFLARRFAISPGLARVVADLCFDGGRR